MLAISTLIAYPAGALDAGSYDRNSLMRSLLLSRDGTKREIPREILLNRWRKDDADLEMMRDQRRARQGGNNQYRDASGRSLMLNRWKKGPAQDLMTRWRKSYWAHP